MPNITNPRLKLNPDTGFYYIHWTEGRRGRRKSTRTNSQTKAHQRFAKWLEANNAEVEGNDRTVRDCLRKYWKDYAKHEVADPDRIKYLIKALLQHMADIKVKHIGKGDFNDYVEARKTSQARAVKISTIRRELSCLKAAFNFCVREKFLNANHVPHVQLPRVPRQPAFWLSQDMVDAMLDYLEQERNGAPYEPLHLFVILALGTAARKNAIEQLTWQQVDFDAGLIRYDMQVEFETRKRKVSVPIADWIQRPLEDALVFASSDYVLGEDFSVRHRFDGLRKRLYKHTGNADFLKMTPHTLRHTWATQSLRNGASIWQVAGVLGDSVETVTEIYGHHVKEHLQEATNTWMKGGQDGHDTTNAY